MIGKSALLDFLLRYPWANTEFTEAVFGSSTFEAIQEFCPEPLQRITLHGVGECLATIAEPKCGVFDLWRCRNARNFILDRFGVEAIHEGMSPSPVADAEFDWNGYRYRVWVDLGYLAAEATHIIRRPPSTYGPHVKDVVLADRARFRDLAAQINLTWGGNQDVLLLDTLSDKKYTVSHRSERGGRWMLYKEEQIVKYFRARQQKDRTSEILAETGFQMLDLDWHLMIEAGNNPVFNRFELAALVAQKFTSPYMGIKELMESIRLCAKRIDWLDQQHIFTRSWRNGEENRLFLSWRGVEMISRYWGIKPADMAKFQPWPLRKDDRGHLEYSPIWFGRTPEHQTLCRQFCLALTMGAWSISNDRGWAKVDLVTTIAGRITYTDINRFGEPEFRRILPDAVGCISIWGCEAEHASALANQPLYVEIDRETYNMTRMREKLEQYSHALFLMRPARPAIIWVIDGSPRREQRILSLMRELKIEGWTTRLDRLSLPAGDPWWQNHRPSLADYEMQAINRLAPYRPIWLHTGQSDETYLPFLGYDPWNDGGVR